MAVRIALQCSEADAHLILSEENTAARLLTRPGEAIYNDANGLFEGNHPFQVVWLPDDERDDYLRRIAELRDAAELCAGRRRSSSRATFWPIPARTRSCTSLLAAPQLAARPARRRRPGSARRWPSRSRPPPSFVRQAGSNLLLAGHREEAALGVMATGLISLAAQHAAGALAGRPRRLPRSRFYVLDGTRPDAPEAGFWHRLVPVLAARDRRSAGPRGRRRCSAELAAELARRQQEGGEQARRRSIC